MKITGVGTVALVALAVVMGGQVAHAQDNNTDGNLGNDGLDPRPEPPRPVIADPDRPPVRQQAGIGGDIAFARAGVIELGGSGGLTLASGLTTFDLSPSVGYFIADNVEVTLLAGITHARTSDRTVNGVNVEGSSSTFARLLLEPSYNLPFNDQLFGFVGIGFGATYAKGVDFGFAVAPRLGLKWMVGRSGILSPSISWIYSTNDLAAGGAPGPGRTATTTATISSAAVLNIGYTVMW